MTPIEEFIEDEKRLDVESVSARGQKVWPYLRVYIGSQILFQKDRRIESKSAIRLQLRSLFYGFRNIFRRYDYVFITSDEQRKEIDGIWYNRGDFIKESGKKTLIIEHAINGHKRKSEIASKYIISKASLFLLEFLLSKILFKSNNIQNKEIVDEFVKKYQLDFNSSSQLARYFSQQKVFSFFLKLWKPKKVFLVNSYINMGYVKAAKEKGLEVIEFQHGVIQFPHYAYFVPKLIDGDCYPDYFLSFGNKEKLVFSKDTQFINVDKVIPVGSFYLDYMRSQSSNDSTNNKMISVTSQDAYEDQIVPFIKEAAEKMTDYTFLFIPRNKVEGDYIEVGFPKNVVFDNIKNTFQKIVETSIHTTFTSTCALEAPALGVANVLMNFEGRSEAYYGDVLEDREVTQFVSSVDEFEAVIRNYNYKSRKDIAEKNSFLFIPDFENNLNKFVKNLA